MAVKIRLTRKGKKKQPTYRVVVADGRSPRDGRYIEQIGRYDPRQEPSIVEIDNERAAYWMSVGAQPSDAVRKLLEISGVLEARPIKIKDPKVHVVDEAALTEDAGHDAAVVTTAEEAATREAASEEATPGDAAAATPEGEEEVTESADTGAATEAVDAAATEHASAEPNSTDTEDAAEEGEEETS